MFSEEHFIFDLVLNVAGKLNLLCILFCRF